mmetsp:Transcript_38692/g.95988  ORF Transcript_38692/g.95988 Transcript_38692/m.95988 type:complete len:249 (-) Transcript_38692:206-952(-)
MRPYPPGWSWPAMHSATAGLASSAAPTSSAFQQLMPGRAAVDVRALCDATSTRSPASSALRSSPRSHASCAGPTPPPHGRTSCGVPRALAARTNASPWACSSDPGSRYRGLRSVVSSTTRRHLRGSLTLKYAASPGLRNVLVTSCRGKFRSWLPRQWYTGMAPAPARTTSAMTRMSALLAAARCSGTGPARVTTSAVRSSSHTPSMMSPRLTMHASDSPRARKSASASASRKGTERKNFIRPGSLGRS